MGFNVVEGEVIIKDTAGNQASVTANDALKSTIVGTSNNEADVTASNALKVDASASPAANAKIEGSVSGNVAEVTAGNALYVDTSQGGTGTNKIEGDTSGNKAEVNATNQLEVINSTANKIKGTVSGNEVEVTAANALKVDASGAGAANIKIEGDTSGNVAEVTANKGLQVEITGGSGDLADVTSAGELKVVNPPPVAPTGTTPVRVVQKSSVSSDDFFTTITNGTTMVLQRVSGGCEPSAAGSVVELYYAPNGNTTGIEIIEDIYVAGSSGQKDLNQEFVGDGTAAILLRRRVFGGGAVEITGRWEGYEQ